MRIELKAWIATTLAISAPINDFHLTNSLLQSSQATLLVMSVRNSYHTFDNYHNNAKFMAIR